MKEKMKIHHITKSQINPQYHLSPITLGSGPSREDSFLTNTVSFRGKTVEGIVADKKKAWTGSKMKWWWSGEDDARAAAIKEMENDITWYKTKNAENNAEFNVLNQTLTGLLVSNKKTIDAKKGQIATLDDEISSQSATKTNINKIIDNKMTLVSEKKSANNSLERLLDEQNRSYNNYEANNKILLREMESNRAKSEFDLTTDLQEQSLKMKEAHAQNMDNLVNKINTSIKIFDPYRRMLNVHLPHGLGSVAGYNEQKRFLLDNFGIPITLEKQKKPASVPNGMLLFGPEGSGKSTLVRAFATQLDCRLMEVPVTSSPQVDMKNLRMIAEDAKQIFEISGQRTILLIRNFEKFAPKESRMTGAMKAFMDDVSKEYSCSVFATTSALDSIDDILLREGRFHKTLVPLADKQNIISILKHYSKDLADSIIDYDKLAEQIVENQSEGAFSNAQIKAVIQSLNQDVLMQNIKNLGSDISKEALELFKHQIEQIKHL